MSSRSKEIVKEGFLAKCPQKQGLLKKWNRRFFVLFKQSPRETARLEYYDDEWCYGRAENKRIIPLRDCQGVYQVPGDKINPYAFEINTAVTVHRFAAQSQPDLDSWMKNLHQVVEECQQSVGSSGARSGSRASVRRSMTMPSQQPQPRRVQRSVVTATPTDSMGDFAPDPFSQGGSPAPMAESQVPKSNSFSTPSSPTTQPDVSFSENSFYNSVEEDYRVRVRVRRTDASFRQGLTGDQFMVVTANCVQLQHITTVQVLASWPLRFIRRYGRDARKFSFEAGRRCGELAGIFEFQTSKGNDLFRACQDRIKLLESDQHKALNPSSFSGASQTNAHGGHSSAAGSLEMPHLPKPYAESAQGHTAVTSGFATISGRGRVGRTAVDESFGGLPAGRPMAQDAGATLPQHMEPLGPPKPSRTRTKSQDDTGVAASTGGSGYSHLKRVANNPQSVTPGGKPPARFSLQEPSQPNVNDTPSPNRYSEVPDRLADALSGAMKANAAAPQAKPRPSAGKASNRPTSLGGGFEEINSQMSEFDQELALLEKKLETFTDAPTTAGSASLASPASRAPPPVASAAGRTVVTPVAASGGGVPRKKRNPFMASPSMEDQTIKPVLSAGNPFANMSNSQPPPTATATSPSHGPPVLPQKKAKKKSTPANVSSPDYEAYESKALPPVPGATAPAPGADVDYEQYTGETVFTPPAAAQPPTRAGQTSAVPALPPLPPTDDYERYDEHAAPPLPADSPDKPPVPGTSAPAPGAGRTSATSALPPLPPTDDYERYDERAAPPLPADSPDKPGVLTSGRDADIDAFGYTKHVRSDSVGPGDGAPSVPRPDYDSVRITSRPILPPDDPPGSTEPPASALGYMNVANRPAVPDLSTVRLRATAGPNPASGPYGNVPSAASQVFAAEDPFSGIGADFASSDGPYGNVPASRGPAGPYANVGPHPGTGTVSPYTNVPSQSGGPPPPIAKPSGLPATTYPTQNDPFSDLSQTAFSTENPYVNRPATAAGSGVEDATWGQYEPVEREDGIADSGSEEEDPFH